MLVVLCCGALGFLPGAAEALTARTTVSLPKEIVPQKSVAGFTFGVTPAAVERKLGAPSLVNRLPSGAIAYLRYPNYGVSFLFDTQLSSDPADTISGFGRGFHTATGIKVGSSHAAVTRAYPAARCDNPGTHECILYAGQPDDPGTRETIFQFARNKVIGIAILKIYGTPIP